MECKPSKEKCFPLFFFKLKLIILFIFFISGTATVNITLYGHVCKTEDMYPYMHVCNTANHGKGIFITQTIRAKNHSYTQTMH